MKKFFAALIIVNFVFLNSANLAFAESVIFNTETQKVHKVSCPHAKKCTKNCVKIEKKDAYSKGGKPCKTCGG